MKLEKIVYLTIGGMSLFSPMNSSANEVVHEKVEVKKQYSPNQIKRMVEKTALDHGVDPYFASAVALHESGYDPKAVSYAGARGVMQLMPETADEYGVVDIHNPVDNIRGGVKLLRDLERRYGNEFDREGVFREVLAAYNIGFPTLDIMKRKYGEDEWFGKLTKGTRRYVNSVLKTYRDTIEVNTPSVKPIPYFPNDCDYVE